MDPSWILQRLGNAIPTNPAMATPIKDQKGRNIEEILLK
jgi:hypothetical protein